MGWDAMGCNEIQWSVMECNGMQWGAMGRIVYVCSKGDNLTLEALNRASFSSTGVTLFQIISR